MLNKLQAVCNKFEELCAKSEQPDFYADPKKAAKLLREKNDLEPIVEAFQAYKTAEQTMLDAQELMSDPEMKELAQEEFLAAKTARGFSYISMAGFIKYTFFWFSFSRSSCIASPKRWK